MANPLLDNKQPIVDSEGKPSMYFIRLLQERGYIVDGKISEADLQTAMNILRNEMADLTLTGLSDVDLTPPPTDGQVLGFSSTFNKWGAVDMSSGGGSSRQTPVLIQQATIRGDGIIALPSAPTVGNIMVFVSAGYYGSLIYYVPPGFTLAGSFSSNIYNGVYCWTKVVTTGDTGSYDLSAQDNQSGVLYEFSKCAGAVALIGGIPDYSGSSGSFYTAPSPYGTTSTYLLPITHDTTPNLSFTLIPGLVQDYASPYDDWVNHSGAFARLTGSELTLINFQSNSGALNSAAYGVFALIGKV